MVRGQYMAAPVAAACQLEPLGALTKHAVRRISYTVQNVPTVCPDNNARDHTIQSMRVNIAECPSECE